MARKKTSNEASTKATDTEAQAGQPTPTRTQQAPAPNSEKPKKGKVEVASDATPDEATEADQRLVDARNEALANHQRQNS